MQENVQLLQKKDSSFDTDNLKKLLFVCIELSQKLDIDPEHFFQEQIKKKIATWKHKEDNSISESFPS